MDVQERFQGGRSGSPPLQIGDMSGDPLHQKDSGEFPSQGGLLAGGELYLKVIRWWMGAPPFPPSPGGETTREAGLEDVEKYITWRQNKVA